MRDWNITGHLNIIKGTWTIDSIVSLCDNYHCILFISNTTSAVMVLTIMFGRFCRYLTKYLGYRNWFLLLLLIPKKRIKAGSGGGSKCIAQKAPKLQHVGSIYSPKKLKCASLFIFLYMKKFFLIDCKKNKTNISEHNINEVVVYSISIF